MTFAAGNPPPSHTQTHGKSEIAQDCLGEHTTKLWMIVCFVFINDLITLITLLMFCQWPTWTPPTVHCIQPCWVTVVRCSIRALRWHLKEYNVVVHLNLHFLDGFPPPLHCIHPAIAWHVDANIPANFRFPFTSKKNVQINMKKLLDLPTHPECCSSRVASRWSGVNLSSSDTLKTSFRSECAVSRWIWRPPCRSEDNLKT